jgi:murein DD-endopeptidase MepM/ murein hydrolase activator NlpD
MRARPWLKALLSILVVALLVGGYFIYRSLSRGGARSGLAVLWRRNTGAFARWQMQAGQRCGSAPFFFPTDGRVGYLWGDSFRPGHRHQGIDVFGGQPAGDTPVLAAASGYLTRLPEWKSSLIIRLPSDPLQPTRQIWNYYTHMADVDGNSYIVPDFPPGTSELYVEAGTLLGYQGNYSGDPFNPTGVHLHFSIVLDDGQGSFRNELEIRNTLDPSPYLGLPLNAEGHIDQIPVCPPSSDA